MILFFISYIVFWIIYYYLESRKNSLLILWKNSTSEKNISKEQKQLSDKYEVKCQEFDGYRKMLVHIIITLPIFLVGANIFAFFSLLFLSFGIKLLLSDLLVHYFLGINVHHIDTINWIDIILREIERWGISQWVVKSVIILITLILSIIFLFI